MIDDVLRKLRDLPTSARHGLVCAALTVLALLQSPGQIVADTKIDMAINPLGFLGRALHLWDPTGSFGQLQNQAYGYLWPMGPFFVLGTGVGLPAWLVQRLWWALLLCVAFLGMTRLAQRLGIGTPASRLIAGLAFALTPRILTEIGAISVEAWPTAVAPWVLIPLVGLSSGGSVRRAVALSGVAVACAGGVNATAVIAVLPLGFLWLLTVVPVRRRLLAIVAWGAAVLAATAWWLVPLLVLGRYSPPFVDFIERAATTTGITDPITVLRGADYWLAYLYDAYRAWLPAGWEIGTQPVLYVATVLVAAAGMAGLARRGMPHRRLLVTGVLVGFALVSMGHVGEMPGTFGEAFRTFLDGAGAPLRNVHKFDVVLRLPLTLGIAHLLGVLLRAQAARPAGDAIARAPRTHRVLLAGRRRLGLLTSAGTLLAILTVATPALTGGLAAAGGFAAVPNYWRDAATWLNQRSEEGRVLVIPGANFPNYAWGDTLDEITQPLLTGDVGVRSVIPMSPATTIRMMDAIESVLTTGDGSPALAGFLARSGVAYLLVRNDLNYGQSKATAPLVVHQALDRSPGLEHVATFGPQIQLSSVDRGGPDRLGGSVPALEVLRVNRPVDRVVAYPAGSVATVVGGPESLLWLAEAGQLPAGPTVLAGDLARLGPDAGSLGQGPVLLTDGLRRRDVSFGSGRDAASTTLTADEGRNAHDYLPAWGGDWTTTAALTGVADLQTSTSWAYKNPTGSSRPEHQAFAALDGDPSTSWRPEIYTKLEGQWLEVTLAQPQPVPEVTVHFDPSAGGRVTRFTVDTGDEQVTVDVTAPVMTVPLRGTDPVRRVRLTIDGFEPAVQFGMFGISELEIPGVTAARTLILPAAPAQRDPAAVVLTAAPSIPSCYVGAADGSTTAGLVRCSGQVARGSEDGLTLDRTLTLGAAANFGVQVWARARPGTALYALLDNLVPAGPTVAASSTAFDEPLARPGAVIDGDAGTTWWAATDDPTPELQLTWPAPQALTGLRLQLGKGVLATPVAAVTAFAAGSPVAATRTDDGLLFDAPVRTSELTLRLEAGPKATAWDPYTNKLGELPIGVSDLTLLTDAPVAPSRPDLDARLNLDCGSGPTLTAGDHVISTRLVATARDLIERRAVPAVPCGPIDAQLTATLPAGTARVIAAPSDVAIATQVALVAGTGSALDQDGAVALRVDSWSSNHRTVTVGPHETDVVLAVRENTNPGWVASIGGVDLAPVITDGWQQGWLVPAGLSGQVQMRFAPDTWYRTGLAAGLVLLLVLGILAVWPSRRRPTGPPTGKASPLPILLIGAASLIITAGVLGAVIVALGAAAPAHRRLIDRHRRPVPLEGSSRLARVGRLAFAAQWLVPSAVLLVAGAGASILYDPFGDWRPQVLGILAVGGLWLHTVFTTASIGRAKPIA